VPFNRGDALQSVVDQSNGATGRKSPAAGGANAVGSNLCSNWVEQFPKNGPRLASVFTFWVDFAGISGLTFVAVDRMAILATDIYRQPIIPSALLWVCQCR
jgi:hypothetical protein